MSFMRLALALIGAPLSDDYEWYRIGGSDTAVYYIDGSTIRADGGTKFAVRFEAHTGPDPSGESDAYHAIVIAEYNCEERSYRDAHWTYLANDGKFLREKRLAPGGRFGRVETGSFEAAMLRFVCERQGGERITGRPVEDAEDFWDE
jgi:hypothetical protein